MSLLLEVLTGGLGIFRKWPVITGLLLFSLVGMGWSYWQGRTGANARFEAQQAEVKLKITKRNSILEKDDAIQAEKEKQIVIHTYKTLSERLKAIEAVPDDGCLDKPLPAGLRDEVPSS